jgi:ATP-dependent DNA ligase
VALQSKRGQALARYVPGGWWRRSGAGRSRAWPSRLAAETPALLLVFDLLVDAEGTVLLDRRLPERRRRLEAAHGRAVSLGRCSASTTRRGSCTTWGSAQASARRAPVCEVRYDHVSCDRFRHGTKFLRWRPDKRPAACTFDQIRATAAGALARLGVGARWQRPCTLR